MKFFQPAFREDDICRVCMRHRLLMNGEPRAPVFFLDYGIDVSVTSLVGLVVSISSDQSVTSPSTRTAVTLYCRKFYVRYTRARAYSEIICSGRFNL